MYKLLVKLMLTAVLLEFGMNAWDFRNCDSRECVRRLERASRKVLDVNWKPISVFPEEGRRFRE